MSYRKNANEVNILDVVYTKGEDGSDGSKRIRYADDSDQIQVETREAGAWNLGELSIAPKSLLLGRNVAAASEGDFLTVEDASLGVESIVAAAAFNDFGSDPARIPRLAPKLFNFVLSGDGSVDVVFTKRINNITPITIESLVTKYYYTTGSVGATAPVKHTIRRDDENGPLIYENNIPAEEWPANTDIELPLNTAVHFAKGFPYYEVLESDEPLSITESPTGVTKVALDVQLYEMEDLVSLPSGTDRFLTDCECNFLADNNGNMIYSDTETIIILPPTAQQLMSLAD